MKRIFVWIIALSVIAIAAVALLWKQDIPPQLPPPVAQDPVPEPKAPPAIQYPLPDIGERAGELPALDQSDEQFLAALAGLRRQLAGLLIPERIVRHIVVTIDNLPRETVAARMRPVKPAPGKFLTSKEGEQLLLADANAERYSGYVRTFEALDPERLVAIYLEFYPLFQKAYQELGYPNRYFNDRLIAVIDHLLDAPEPDGTIALAQPRVLYEFADPELQQASAGHKIMMRMGVENAKRVKAHLEKIRARVAAASEQIRSPS